MLGEARERGKMITLAMRHTSRELERMVSLPTPLSALQSRRYLRAVKRLDQTVERLITERRTGNQQNPPDLLSPLLEAQDQNDGTEMTDQQVRNEAMTLLQAGHKTTANALSWACVSADAASSQIHTPARRSG